MRLNREIIPVSVKKQIESNDFLMARYGATLSYGKKAIGVYRNGLFEGNLYYHDGVLVQSLSLKRSCSYDLPYDLLVEG